MLYHSPIPPMEIKSDTFLASESDGECFHMDIEIQSPDCANIKSLQDLQDTSTEEFNMIEDEIRLAGAFPSGLEPYSKDLRIVKDFS